MTYEEKYNILTEDDIATDEEIRLVCCINGISTEQLDNILYVRTGYRSFEDYVSYEIFHEDDEEEAEISYNCLLESVGWL